jgi:hypothetical protein
MPIKGRNSHLDWLEWFNDFRNQTKGHGVLEEKAVAPFWHNLHETFLKMVAQMRFLTISSELVVNYSTSKEMCLKGWMRNGYRNIYSYSSTSSIQPFSNSLSYTYLESPHGQVLHLYPLVIVRSGEALIWDAIRKKEQTIEFLNFASWKRQSIPFSVFPETHPYKIWHNVKNRTTVTVTDELN